MDSRFFKHGVSKCCNPALLALALMSVSAPSAAATVAPDFSCHASAAACFDAEGRLSRALAPAEPETDTSGFSNAARVASARSRLDKDKETGLVSLLAQFWSSFDFAFLRSAVASEKLPLIQAQASDSHFSESFLNPPPDAAPVPATVWLIAVGLFGFVAIARRRREHPHQPAGNSN